MPKAILDILDNIPQGPLGIIAMKGCEELAQKVSDQIVECRAKFDDAENGDLIHTNDDTIRDDVASLIVRYQWKSGVYSVTKIEEESLRPCTR